LKPARLHSAAERELEDAEEWYERERPGLGSEFVAEVEAALLRVCTTPKAFVCVADLPPQLSEIRRAHLHRFPYHLVYFVHDDAVRILAVAHNHRRPGYWLGRIGEA
jgi:toxin ParE1/3/4